PLGALCAEQDNAAVVGRTNLRDGQWHHVAVLFLGGGKNAHDTVQVKQFVDGKLEGTGAFSWKERPIAPAPAEAGKLTVGHSGPADSAVGGFMGTIDELF